MHNYPDRPPRRCRSRWGAGHLVVIINAVLAGIGGVYATTRSTTVTIVAAAGAVIVATVALRTRQ